MEDDFAQALGFVAGALVLATFYTKTMSRLRMVAIGSNVAFVVYGVSMGLTPIVVLHAMLLPLNVVRLTQLRRMEKKLRDARSADFDPAPLMRHFRRHRFVQGTVLFSQG